MLKTRTHTFGAKLFRAESIILEDELIICGEVYHTLLLRIINNKSEYCWDKDRTKVELVT